MLDQLTGNDTKTSQYYSHARKEILPLLPKDVSRIFEVGCGAGDTLSFLKKSGGCKWAGGVELFHEAAELARTKDIDLVLEGNINDCFLPIELGSLDVILCLDVLEHLADPWTALHRLNKYIKRGGVLICSIPNIRNFRVVVPLIMKGEWNYSKEGILDQAHLRFFTKESATTLVASSGFHVDMVSSTGLEKWNKAAILNLLTLNVFKAFFEFQYLIRGIKIAE